jgi:hydrogenase expression/formation protein HypC
MCLARPMQVVETDGAWAWCDDRGQRVQVDVRLVQAAPAGSWVLVFLGTAREVVDAARAADVANALEAVEASLRGEVDVSRYFADLVDREPQLPEFLRPAAGRKEVQNG